MKIISTWILSALLVFGTGVQAQAPDSVLKLLKALPGLPAQAEHAATWFDKAGRLVHPPLLQLQAAIADHQQAMLRIREAQGRAGTEQGQVLAHNVFAGLQDVGIDPHRMQADPAYARQVQERLRKMTPAEQMALAQRMARPMNQDPRVVNQAAAMAQDLPAARAAAQAGLAYVQLQPQRFERHAALWAETESAVQRLRAQPLRVHVPKPAMAWDNLGCDQHCQAQWDAYAAKMLPLLIVRESEILALRRTAVQRQRAALAADIHTAEQHLQATEFSLASTSAIHQGHIVDYDAAVVAEIVSLFDRTVEAAKSAAVLPHCDVQAVLVPRAVCR